MNIDKIKVELYEIHKREYPNFHPKDIIHLIDKAYEAGKKEDAIVCEKCKKVKDTQDFIIGTCKDCN